MSSAVRAVLAVRTVRAPSAVVTEGRLVALDEESSLLRAVSAAAELPVRAVLCSVPLVRAVVCSVRLALSPRESLLEVPPRKPSLPRLPESSRRSE